MMHDQGATSRGRILVIDDEPANVRLLSRLLVTGGFTEFRGTTDPRETFAMIEEFQPDLVMLDLNMPYIDGHEILRKIRERPKRDYLPVMVLTADTTQATKERALSAGASDFLTKPFERTEVLLRTRNLLESRFLHQALQEDNRNLEAKVSYQALHDALTGLANRSLFRDRVEHAVARAARNIRSSLLFLDLDDFKSVNDALGHVEGDRLLQALADRLTRAVRGCDTVARLGGDEFGILLDDIQTDADALIVVERIMESMRAPIMLHGRSVTIAASIGIAPLQPGEHVDEALRNADVAMYHAKGTGKGRYAMFEPSMYDALVRRLQLADDLRGAVTRGELELLYQPIVDLTNGDVTSVEALVRWRRPGGAESSPATFIPVAEETGMIVPIGRWVLAEACRQAKAWQDEFGDDAPTMSVNVSARQLADRTFIADVTAILFETQLAPERLTLEITEGVVVESGEAVERLRDLKALGVRLAIDDFGIGYSSLGYLHRLPFDIIKIDKTFVAGMRDSEQSSVAGMIVGLASSLRVRTVAEGIEDEAQRLQLLALGCSSGQGYLFARPVGATEMAGMFDAGTMAPTS